MDNVKIYIIHIIFKKNIKVLKKNADKVQCRYILNKMKYIKNY